MSQRLKGKLLIAGFRLRDPNFFKTAVLVVEHNKEGAMGLVINRPSDMTVADVLAGHIEMPEPSDVSYLGGPVEPAALFIIHDGCEYDPDEAPVVPGMYVASSISAFQNVIQAAAASEPVRYRIYQGCAGWGAGQLEGEIARGDWMIIEGDEDLVFHEDAYALWEELVNAVYAKHRLLPHPEISPEWN
jgi:putative transcriptional regulator